jgi:hypothetical protein
MPALLIGVNSAKAALLYSFENGDVPNNVDGFAPNGGGVTVSHDTIGATNGTGSMKLVTSVGGTFVGALSTSAVPLATLDNPSISGVSFDITTAAPQYAGNYADIGITLFVANPGLGEFGEQFQTNFVPSDNIDLAPGTYHVTHPLYGNDPDTGTPESYSQLLANGFVPTGFEFFISKDATAAATVYLDNVNTVSVPEPATLALGAVGGVMALARRRRSI